MNIPSFSLGVSVLLCHLLTFMRGEAWCRIGGWSCL